MIYPKNFESKIKFDVIRRKIAAYCLSDMGREVVEELAFSSDPETIRRCQEENTECIRICREEDDFPAAHYRDARPFLLRIRTEGLFLDVPELVILKHSLESLHALLRFFKGRQEKYPHLTARAGNIQLFPYLLQRLDAVISKHGAVKDSASPALANIRQSILKKQAGISRRMNALLQKAQEEGWADKESAVAIRDGRMVIPVPAAYKRKLNGIVHDESATGKTSYIEPTEIIETNNEVRELQNEEKREITRILRQLADDIRPYIDDLLPGYDFLAFIDFVRAKSLFSIDIQAIVPKFETKASMEWYRAIHPVLLLNFRGSGKEVVPLDLRIDHGQRIVLISGPNAGGKSVCLQTAGLLQYMFQCGLPVPVSENSVFGIFSDILIDMGDEQSIDNDLSTYSSHLLNMKQFLRHASDRSLILIDEFGTGTEPMLGGAIAEAILHALNEKEVRGVITTHYTNLKHFAASAPGIENGAMLYDAHGMQPLFRLETGKPGSSFAFEIAKKIGLPREILEEAAGKVGEEHVQFDKHLKDIIRDKRYWEEKRRRIHQHEKRLEEVLDKYRGELEESSSMRKKIIKEAKEKAAEIIREANKTIENTIREIRESQAEKEKTQRIRTAFEEKKEQLTGQEGDEDFLLRKMQQLKRREQRKEERKQQKKKTPAASTPKEPPAPTGFSPGDRVQLDNGTIGEIIEISEKSAVIALGELITTVKPERLTRISGNQVKKIDTRTVTRTSNYLENISRKRLDFSADIDVRGLRGEEALARIITFIDDAVMLGSRHLRILHGTGTGALRQMIRDYLKTQSVVAGFEDEHVQHGGTGITKVTLDL